MASLASKVFTVIGGAFGIGLATCRMLAQSKAKGISVADYNDKNFESVRAELQSNSHDIAVHTKKFDVTNSSQVDAWIDEVVKQFGGIDGAVNAAGVTQRFGTYTLEHCTRALVKGMMDLPREPRSIVNVASIASLMHGGDCFS